MKYFLNCTILDKDSLKILFQDNYFKDKTEVEKIFYFIINKKIILTYGFVINIGILTNNNIFESEILILCSSKENFNSTINDIIIFSIEKFSNQVNIEQKNIGKYKGNNIVVFINSNYIPKKKIIEEKKMKLENLRVSENIIIDANKKQSPIINGKNEEISQKEKFKISSIDKTPSYIYPIIICFCHLTKFVNYFIHKQEKNNITDKSSLTYLFKDIIEKIVPSSNQNNQNKDNIINKHYTEITKIVANFVSLFNKNINNSIEPFDYVNFILMKLNKELNKSSKEETTFFYNNLNVNIDQTNEESMWNNFFQKFIYENKSIISDIFYGTLHNQIKCSNNFCGVIKHNFEIFQYLTFNLDNIKQFKIDYLNNFMKLNNQMNNQQMLLNLESLNTMNSVTIYDCFDYQRRIQTLTNDDKILCDRCNNNLSSYYQTNIYTPPEILILIIVRAPNSKIKLEFIEDMDLLNYITKGNEIGFMFKLTGVISEEEKIGQYVAFCRSEKENQWYRYDNDSVLKINNFKKQIVDAGMIHILFYQKSN